MCVMDDKDVKVELRLDLVRSQEAEFLLGLQGREVVADPDFDNHFYGTVDKVGEHFIQFRGVTYFSGSAIDGVEPLRNPETRDGFLSRCPCVRRAELAIYNKNNIRVIYPL